MKFILPDLPYKYDFLEPYFDKQTMEIHHTKHHQTYIDNTNTILENLPEFCNLSIYELMKVLDKVPLDKKTFLRNNAGGHANHSIFWKCLKIGTSLQGVLKEAIESNFDSFDNFKAFFEKQAMSHFGSGWVWLVKTESKLCVISTSNQDNPIMDSKMTGVISGLPIISLDLWEHSYYLKYQNRRLEYIKSFWNVVNWDEATIRYASDLIN